MIADELIIRSMLSMSETLRQQTPPKLKMAIKVARGALKIALGTSLEAHCHLQLGKLILFYSEHYDVAKYHLQLSYDFLALLGDFHVEKRLEALCLLSELYIHTMQWPFSEILNLIRKELPYARSFTTKYYKLLFYFIEAIKLDDNVNAALDACNIALKSTENDKTMQLYFRICKHLINYDKLREEPEQDEIIKIGTLIMEMEKNPEMTQQLKSIKGFFMCTKLAFMLSEGLSRSSRTLLRQLQQEVSGSSKDLPSMTGIRFMDEKAMTVFACVMNVVSAHVQCSYERVLKYHQLAVKHADEIVTKSCRNPQEFGVIRAINEMKMMSLQLMSLTNIMAARPQLALTNIHEMIGYSTRAGGPNLYNDHSPVMQYILGVICSYLRQNELAENHFRSSLKLFGARGNRNTVVLVFVNLAICYLNQLKLAEYYDISGQFSPAKIANGSPMVRMNVKFVNIMYTYLNQKSVECKVMLHELLNEAKGEDFFRLHGLSVLMSSLIMSIDEATVKPTVDWSLRSFDHVVIVWSHSLYSKMLADRGADSTEIGEAAKKSFQMLDLNYLMSLLTDAPAANLLQWFEGEPHVYLPKDDI